VSRIFSVREGITEEFQKNAYDFDRDIGAWLVSGKIYGLQTSRGGALRKRRQKGNAKSNKTDKKQKEVARSCRVHEVVSHRYIPIRLYLRYLGNRISKIMRCKFISSGRVLDTHLDSNFQSTSKHREVCTRAFKELQLRIRMKRPVKAIGKATGLNSSSDFQK
jgi:hypothetical protein